MIETNKLSIEVENELHEECGVFGAYDFAAGACGSAQNVFTANKTTEIYSGICEGQCTEILQNFFKDLRTQG